MENSKNRNQTSIFTEKDMQEHLSRLSIIFINGNPVIQEEFIQWVTKQYKNDLESYFKILNNYLIGDRTGAMPAPMFVRY